MTFTPRETEVLHATLTTVLRKTFCCRLMSSRYSWRYANGPAQPPRPAPSGVHRGCRMFPSRIQRLYFSGGLGIPTRPERRNAQCAAAGHDLPGAFRVAPDKYRIRLKAAVMVHRKRRHVRTSAACGINQHEVGPPKNEIAKVVAKTLSKGSAYPNKT